MAKFLKQASRAAKSELRRAEASQLSQRLASEFEDALQNRSLNQMNADELNHFIEQKIQQTQAKFRKHVKDSHWKATEEFDAELSVLLENLNSMSISVRNDQSKRILEDMGNFRSQLLKDIDGELAIRYDTCLPTEKQFDERTSQIVLAKTQKFEDFISKNNLHESEALVQFVQEASSRSEVARNNFIGACVERDLKIKEAVQSFSEARVVALNSKLKENFKSALQNLRKESQDPFEFLETFKKNSAKELRKCSKEMIAEAKTTQPLPAICSREIFIQKLNEL